MSMYEKDPNAVLDYVFDWTAWLGTDTITGTPTITAQTGITLASQSNTTTTVTAWISGGTVGQTYSIACKIVTTAGRTDERTISIRCENK